jgi:uncharacterized protein (TIGR01319 family)
MAVARRIVVTGDIGSTFTKVSVLCSDTGSLITRAVVPTDHADLARGLEAAVDDAVSPGMVIEDTAICSSAAGGLRVGVIGLEPRLTLEAGRRAAASAGARVVAVIAGTVTGDRLEQFSQVRPDVVLLVGGTNGGDRAAVIRNAALLAEHVDDSVAVVVAANEDAHAEMGRVLGPDRLVRFAPNVLPRIGRLDVEGAQREIRELFVEHVIGKGRFASRTSSLVGTVTMPTPSAVLAGTRVLSRVAGEGRARPVVVDVGGATTDVHSVLPVERRPLAYLRDPVPEAPVTRTVEADLGIRENASTLVEEVLRQGYVTDAEAASLRASAARRELDRRFVPTEDSEIEVDGRLAVLATACALARHAGELRVSLTDDGAALRKTGRDLRAATCIVASGGVFEAASDARALLASALELARQKRSLVPATPLLLVDAVHALASAGVLAERRPQLAEAHLAGAFVDRGLAHVG